MKQKNRGVSCFLLFLIKPAKLIIALHSLLTAGECLCQVEEFYVRPNQTDGRYPAQDSHFIAYNAATQNGKLFLFIGGTFSSPKNYDYITRYAAALGFDAVSLTYPNGVLTTLLAGSSDSLAFDKFRQEICFGTQVSPAVSVDTLNSIYTRTLKLMQFLSHISSHNWSRYLASDSTLDWSQIVVSGHSQGAGHACYLGKQFSAHRVVMFSGPNDYSTYFSNSAPWLRQAGTTAISRHFVFLHLQDEVVPFSHQLANIAGLGMLEADDTTLVDDIRAPFLNSHCLYSNHAPGLTGNYHSSTVIYSATPLDGQGNPIFLPVWEYMLTSTLSTGIARSAGGNRTVLLYPNPVNDIVTIEHGNSGNAEIFIINLLGQLVHREHLLAGKKQIDLSILPSGNYFLCNDEAAYTIIKK